MQRGIGSIVILIILAVIIGISAMAYGYFIVFKNTPNQIGKQTVQLPPKYLIPPPEPQIGTPECPDTDYTGCDNTSQFMTWDGPLTEQTSGVTQEGTIYSK